MVMIGVMLAVVMVMEKLTRITRYYGNDGGGGYGGGETMYL